MQRETLFDRLRDEIAEEITEDEVQRIFGEHEREIDAFVQSIFSDLSDAQQEIVKSLFETAVTEIVGEGASAMIAG